MDEKKILMTEGSIWRVLVRFAFPLFLGGLFQNLYTAVDSLVVGRFCGDNALAAVASSGSLCRFLIGFFQGVFMGGSVIISNRYGAGDREGVDRSVHTLVVFSLISGAVLTVLGVLFTPLILEWMNTPDNVMPNSVLYFRIYCSGLLALVLYNTANGIFQALGDSRHPLYYLIISSVANVVLDLLFVAGFHWGVAGASAATVLGQALSAVLAFAHLMSGRFIIRVRLRSLKPDLGILKQVFRLGIPGGIQNSVISLANVIVQGQVNTFGDAAMAGCGSYARVEGVVFLPVMTLVMAMTTFTSQNLGAEKRDRARQGARQGTVMAVVLAEAVGVVTFILAPRLIGLFSKTPEVLQYGVLQTRVESLFFCLLAVSHSCAAVLRGAGQPVVPMAVLLSVWCVFRIIFIAAVTRFIPSITVLFAAYPITWGISAVLLICALKRKDWTLNTKL